MLTAGDELDPIFRVARGMAGAIAAWHRVQLLGVEHLPPGPALLVGNHGLFGLETPAFFHALHRASGRIPVGLADRRVFGAAPVRRLLERLGGVPGTRENALGMLAQGRLVVCYPGGSREVFKGPEAHYRLAWERAVGFARVAITARVPVIPFAGLGVDDTFINFGHLPLSRRVLGRYAVPFGVGLGAVPLPVRLRFRLAAPLKPPRRQGEAARFKADVQAIVESLLEDHAAHPQGPATSVH